MPEKDNKSKSKSEKEDKPKKKTGSKRKRDNTHEKKPLTPFFIFSREHRSDLAKSGKFPSKKNPNKTNTAAIAKELGKMWKELPKDEKKIYSQSYAKEKEEYDKLEADSSKLPTYELIGVAKNGDETFIRHPAPKGKKKVKKVQKTKSPKVAEEPAETEDE